MMEDQLESPLENLYEEATRRARRVVASDSRFDLANLNAASGDYPEPRAEWREVWRISVHASAAASELLLAVPLTFPDELPTAYLPKRDRERFRFLPHVDDKGLVCTFDRVEALPNADTPAGVAIAVIERAIKILADGKSGANYEDYSDEFSAYWRLGCALATFCLVLPTEDTREVVGLSLKSYWNQTSFLFAETKLEGERWLAAAGYRGATAEQRVLYLPLKSLGIPPLPSTNGEVYDVLRKADGEVLRSLLGFLDKVGRPACVLFSVPTGTAERVLGAWWHPSFSYKAYQGAGRLKHFPGHVRGFRPGHGSSRIELSVQERGNKLVRAEIVRVDSERLLGRSAGTKPRKRFDDWVNIIGCGSIGSLMAEALARSGAVTKLRLIDPELLGVENVQRHYCGISDVGKHKCTAIAERLGAHFPQLEFDVHEEDVLDLLRQRPSALGCSSLTIAAIGDLAVERRLNQVQGNGDVLSPLCYLWVEPYVCAGHAILIQDVKQSCFECAFDDEFLFVKRVVTNAKRLVKREAGCQSSFVPFSGIDAQQYVSRVLRFLLMPFDNNANSLFSWYGDLAEARENGALLADEYALVPSFSSRVIDLQSTSTCRTEHKWKADIGSRGVGVSSSTRG